MSRALFVITFVVVSVAACAADPAPPVSSAASAPPPQSAGSPAPPLAPDNDAPQVPMPETSAGWKPLQDVGQTFSLKNGIRVVVVERHEVPFVSSRVMVASPMDSNDADAELRMTLVPNVLLRPSDSVGQINPWCNAHACGLDGQGGSDELGLVLEREASLVRNEPATAEMTDALARTAKIYEGNVRLPGPTAFRDIRVLLFGHEGTFGATEAFPKAPTLDALRRWRRRAFVPRATTIVLLGDVTLEQAKVAVTRAFGEWRSTEKTDAAVHALPPLPAEPRIAVSPNDFYPSDYGAIVVRGPTWTDPDLAPAFVATTIYQTGLSPPTPCTESKRRFSTSRETFPFRFYREVSIVTLGGYFEPKTAVPALTGVLAAIRASRDTELTPEALASAKQVAIANWRRIHEESQTFATMVGLALDEGVPERAFDVEARIEAVSAADLRRVARRFFAEDELRAVLIGAGRHFVSLSDLQLHGEVRLVQPFAAPAAAPTK